MNDTPDILVIFNTLRSKINNLTDGEHWDATFVARGLIRNKCYHYEYVGIAKSEVIFWCEKNFGNDWVWEHDHFYFKHERDLIHFLLRWK